MSGYAKSNGVSFGIFFGVLMIVAVLVGSVMYVVATEASAESAAARAAAAMNQCEQENSQMLKGISNLVERVRNWVREGRGEKIGNFLNVLNQLRQTYFQARDYIDALAGLTQPPPTNASRAELISYADFQSRNINTIFGQATDFKDLVQALLTDTSALLADP